MGAQSPPPPLFRSGHPSREREIGRRRELEREREREARYRRRNEACIQMERLSLSLSVSRLSRNVVLARLGSRQSKFSQIPRKSFLPRGADALFALLPRIGGREGRRGGISPMGYTGFFVSINSLHPDMRGL